MSTNEFVKSKVNQRPEFNPYWGLLLDFFCFHVVKPLMSILVLLPPANKVSEGYVFTGVCLSTEGRGGGHVWQGVCMAGGKCVVGGHAWRGRA